MGVPLNFKFLGNAPGDQGNEYTPLIIPGSVGYENFINFDNQKVQVLPTGETVTANKPVPPFSKIRNTFLEGNPNNNAFRKNVQLVNVVRDYPWTISPITSKEGKSIYDKSDINDEVPYIELKEKYFLVNSLIAQGLYTLAAGLEFADEKFGLNEESIAGFFTKAGNSIRSFLSPVGDAIGLGDDGTPGPDVEGPPAEEDTGLLGEISSSIGDFGTNLSDKASKLREIYNSFKDPDLESVLFPYQRLYLVGSTGFKYKMPYMNNEVNNLQNQFSDSPPNYLGKIQNIINSGTNIAELVGALSEVVGLGPDSAGGAGSARIERPKYYNYPDSGQPITFNFHLFNTSPSTYEEICNNFKLIFLLLYQNAPLRQDRLIVQPPVLYDVKIPGGRREPYCYISALSINYLGATRMMDIDMSGVSSSSDRYAAADFVKTIVPDAYQVTISLQPMLAQSKNLMYTTVSEEKVVTYTNLNSPEINAFFEGTNGLDAVNAVSAPNSTTEIIKDRSSIFPEGLG